MEQNISFCLREAHNIGYDTIYNVCHPGTFTKVPWGVMDWLAGGTALVAFTAVTAMIVGVSVAMVKDYYNV